MAKRELNALETFFQWVGMNTEVKALSVERRAGALETAVLVRLKEKDGSWEDADKIASYLRVGVGYGGGGGWVIYDRMGVKDYTVMKYIAPLLPPAHPYGQDSSTKFGRITRELRD